MKVLIIEDERSIAELERDYLQVSGFTCDIAADGETGLKMALEGDYALVIVDIMLPGRDGFSVCTELRKAKDIPIIFLSAKGEDIDKVRGLGLGADTISQNLFHPPNWSHGYAPISTDIIGWSKKTGNKNMETSSPSAI